MLSFLEIYVVCSKHNKAYDKACYVAERGIVICHGIIEEDEYPCHIGKVDNGRSCIETKEHLGAVLIKSCKAESCVDSKNADDDSGKGGELGEDRSLHIKRACKEVDNAAENINYTKSPKAAHGEKFKPFHRKGRACRLFGF